METATIIRPKHVRLSYLTLEEHTRYRVQDQIHRMTTQSGSPRDCGTQARATVWGTSVACVRRWQKRGLTIKAADQVAAALDEHPVVIWGPEWWEGLQDDDL